MSRLIVFVFFLGCTYAKAQQDTVYVLYENIKPNYITKLKKHRNDPDPRNYYPFDGGRHYNIIKKVGRFDNGLYFIFNSYTPKWMDIQFYYQEVDKSVLDKKDFKDREWFDKTSYEDIIKYFSRNEKGEKVIMLLDETHLNDEKVYLVRVYFDYDAEE